MTPGAATTAVRAGLVSLTMLMQSVTPIQAHAPEIDTVAVAAGPFIQGSNRAEREAAYQLDEAAYGHSVTRKNKWYESEPARRSVDLPAFHIMRTPVTNALYARFVKATGHRVPDVDKKTWKGYRLIHPYKRTRQFAWKAGKIPGGREQHPVVMVSRADADAFAKWLSERTGKQWSLPTEQQWEKAARGPDGNRFPWGDTFNPGVLNSHDKGPFTTMPVGSFADGASPYGMLDSAGQVFEWTSTSASAQRSIVKGGSWDDSGCGVCRPAARHSRPDSIKHILVGFRLVHMSLTAN
ncbi:SUMF1/EgtB/PvdO family nonheme iron enzyme [Anderseniella sp. Alg231-50]|uniref:SUMF1/EgtB/PvdO family nonheme iron enzyme n=1 Tax=Anderseniella sp. Alg231-50 TaxID=1922226 RepID=UPI000D55C961